MIGISYKPSAECATDVPASLTNELLAAEDRLREGLTNVPLILETLAARPGTKELLDQVRACTDDFILRMKSARQGVPTLFTIDGACDVIRVFADIIHALVPGVPQM